MALLSWHQLWVYFRANMRPFFLQKSTKILPKIDSKMHHFFHYFFPLFFFDFDGPRRPKTAITAPRRCLEASKTAPRWSPCGPPKNDPPRPLWVLSAQSPQGLSETPPRVILGPFLVDFLVDFRYIFHSFLVDF